MQTHWERKKKVIKYTTHDLPNYSDFMYLMKIRPGSFSFFFFKKEKNVFKKYEALFLKQEMYTKNTCVVFFLKLFTIH